MGSGGIGGRVVLGADLNAPREGPLCVAHAEAAPVGRAEAAEAVQHVGLPAAILPDLLNRSRPFFFLLSVAF